MFLPSGEEVSAPSDDWDVIETLESGWPRSNPGSCDQLGGVSLVLCNEEETVFLETGKFPSSDIIIA